MATSLSLVTTSTVHGSSVSDSQVAFYIYFVMMLLQNDLKQENESKRQETCRNWAGRFRPWRESDFIAVLPVSQISFWRERESGEAFAT